MKILQVNASYKPAYIYGGPTMSVAKLSEELVKAGHSISVYTTTANGDTELPVTPNRPFIIDGVTVTYFKRITKDHTHLSPALLVNLWRTARRFDVIHIHAWWNLVSVFAALIGVVKKIPVVISPRGTLSSYSFSNKNKGAKSLLHNLLGMHLLNRSYLHATSPAEKNELLNVIQPTGIFDIPNFVKIATASPQKKTTQPVFKLLFLSRIEEKKGLDILLHALPDINVPYHLTIAGDGEESYIEGLKNIAQNNKTTQHISWIGFQSDNKFDVYAEHDLLVLPSHNENFGNVVIESLSVGTAVLISQQVGLAYYVVNNSLGWLCQINAQSVSDMINHIALCEKDQLTAISANAPAIIHRDFDEVKLVEKYTAMYQQITTNGRL